jgi:CheY-like chemotaxis protein
VAVTLDGNETWQALQAKGAPQLAILDGMMPGMGGVGLKCHRFLNTKTPPDDSGGVFW